MEGYLAFGLSLLIPLSGCGVGRDTRTTDEASPSAEDGAAGFHVGTVDAANAASDDDAGTPLLPITEERLTGDWSVMYGSPSVVTISREGNKFVMKAKDAIQVTGSNCFIPAGTHVATIEGNESPFPGVHGLWSTVDCGFMRWKEVEFELDNGALSTRLNAVQEFVKFTQLLE